MRSFYRTQNVFRVNDLAGFDAFLTRHRCKRLGDGEQVGFQQRQDDTYFPAHVRPEEHFRPFLAELATFLATGEVAIVCHVAYQVEFTGMPGWILATLLAVESTGLMCAFPLDSALEQLSFGCREPHCT
jgi:hypothetical protein